jgi:hypothetical protein
MGIKQLTKLIGDAAPDAIKVQWRARLSLLCGVAQCCLPRTDRRSCWSTVLSAALPRHVQTACHARFLLHSHTARVLPFQEIKIDSYFGRKVAVDASMSIYQFLIAMQRPDGTNMLTNDAGEVTSHITGLMFRTTKMLEVGIKPVYVFDGKPPDLKKGTLDDRREKRQEADEALAKAKEEGDQEGVEKVRHAFSAIM